MPIDSHARRIAIAGRAERLAGPPSLCQPIDSHELPTRALAMPPRAAEPIPVAPRQPMNTVPEKLGNYTIGAELGRGGMGVVYRARDERLGREVAIKLLFGDGQSGASRMELLRQEARVLASLNHPNIASIFGMEESGGAHYMILELVEGDTLRTMLSDGSIELWESLKLCAQIAQAMEAAHARRIIHRDLKPDNVKFTLDGRAKVLDFGLAKQVQVEFLGDDAASEGAGDLFARMGAQDLGAANLNRNRSPRALMGTPAYMSPEHVRGEEIDQRTDIWAFGCILYECLSGISPFDGDDVYDIVAKVICDEPDYSLLPARTPLTIRELIVKCLAKHRDQRISSMAAVRRALRTAEELRTQRVSLKCSGNLPASVTTFIGRESELEITRKMLAEARVLTLTGSGGCGKTRLSMQLAREVQNEMEDGAWIVELAALTEPELVIQEICSTLGLKPMPGISVLETVIEHLRSRSMLLLLDNCEHLLDITAEVVDALVRKCPRLKIVTSSREALGIPGEVSYRVPSLKTASPKTPSTLEEKLAFPAIRLFNERATAANPSFRFDESNHEIVAQICHRLDGIPLAIELAAARVRMLSVDQIASKLDDRFRLLTGGSRTSLPRQQTLRALIDWSYDHLTAEEQELLRSVAVFVGEWTFEAALWVRGEGSADELHTLDVLSRLVDKSLVIAEAGANEFRYRLLETIRQYARDRMLEAGEAEMLRKRHLTHYRRFAMEAARNLGGADDVLWLGKVERELDNLREAMDWCFGDEVDVDLGIDVALSLPRFWTVRGYLHEGYDRLAIALQKSSTLSAKRQAEVRVAMGSLALELGQLERARELFKTASVTFAEVGDEPGAANATANVGHTSWRMGQLEEADLHLQDALRRMRALGRRSQTAGILRSLGIIMYRRGDMTTAMTYLEEATTINRELGNEHGLSGNLQLTALIEFRKGNRGRAGELHREALALMQKLNYRPGIAMQLINLGNLESEAGNLPEARSLLQQALALARELGRKVTIAEALGSLGDVLQRMDDSSGAIAHYSECLEICRQMRDRQGEARALLGLARLERAASRPGTGWIYLRQSIELFHACGSTLELGLALQEAAKILESEGRLEDAARLLGAARREWTQMNVSVGPDEWNAQEKVAERLSSLLGAETFKLALTDGQFRAIDAIIALL